MEKKVWRQCGSKNRYKSEHDVNQYRKKYERIRGKALNYYWCEYCNGYHLTNAKVFYYETVEMEDETTETVVADS